MKLNKINEFLHPEFPNYKRIIQLQVILFTSTYDSADADKITLLSRINVNNP